MQIDAVDAQILFVDLRQRQRGKLSSRAGIVTEQAQLVGDLARLFCKALQILHRQHQVGDIGRLHAADVF